jgi:hypothetical protein
VSQTDTTSASVASCAAAIVAVAPEDVGDRGAYEVIGTVDPSAGATSTGSEFLEERLRERACAIHADAAGLLRSGTRTEFVALRKRTPEAN